MKTRALLIHNPRAGQRDRTGEIEAVVSRLSSSGWQVDLAFWTGAPEMEHLVRAAVVAGAEAVVVSGGDGSINVALQALAYTRTALGVLPTGTTNVWAREMRVPRDLRAAAEALVAGQVAEVDLGIANGRYFLTAAGIGFDASITRDLEPRAKRRLGMSAYIVAGLVEALTLRGTEVTIAAGGATTRQRILMALATNVRLYGGVVKMAPGAFADDGLLDVWVFRGTGFLGALLHVTNVLLGLHGRDPRAESFTASTLSIQARSALPVQLDGDYFGTTPVEIRVAPRALRAIVPPGPHPQLRGGQ